MHNPQAGRMNNRHLPAGQAMQGGGTGGPEMGPGPGVHGGMVVVQGTLSNLLACKASPTGQYLSGKRSIATPKRRRKGNGKLLTVRGARENNQPGADSVLGSLPGYSSLHPTCSCQRVAATKTNPAPPRSA